MYESKKDFKLGIMLKELLKEHSISMHRLSKLTGIDTATISRIINGKQPANIKHLQKFAQCLDVPIYKLLIASGYITDNWKQQNILDTHIIVDLIQKMLNSSNLLSQQYDLGKIEQELDKYEQYAQTEEGKEIIHTNFKEKINNVNGNGLFIEQLKQMYEQFYDGNISTKKRIILGSGLLYFILSTDIIPDYVFPIGYLDDVLAIKLVLDRLSKIKEVKQNKKIGN